MPTARTGLRVAVVNGILYAIGGADNSGANLNRVEAYDPATNTWSQKAPMATARQIFAAGALNGTIYALGGVGLVGNSFGALASVEAYDPAGNTWTPAPPLP